MTIKDLDIGYPKLYENGSISVEEYETLKNDYESSKNDLI